MKYVFKAAVAAIALTSVLSGPVHAQSATSGSEANSGSSSSVDVANLGNGASASNSASQSSGVSSSSGNTAIFNSGGESESTVTYDGDYTVRNVPQVSAPSMGSGHPCGLGGSIGLAIVGGGATGGATRVDDACMLAQMGLTKAATAMIASRNRDACKALVAAGHISDQSYCTRGRGGATTTASTRNPTRSAATETASISAYVTCTRNDSGQIVAKKRRNTPFSDQQVAAYCR